MDMKFAWSFDLVTSGISFALRLDEITVQESFNPRGVLHRFFIGTWRVGSK